jgi:hypothetical protein
MTQEEIQEMADAYIEAALFTADEEIIPSKPGEFDPGPYLPRISKDMKKEAIAVCSAFYSANTADLANYPALSAGIDLWLTRNGHGCGFWEADHCAKEEGERLTASARKLGSRDVWKYWGRFRFVP